MIRENQYMFARFSLAVVLVLCTAWTSAAQNDGLTSARQLATSGHRAEAVQLLRTHLAERPDDADARTFLGTVLSWEGDYEGSRRELEAVLKNNPMHDDALAALVNVELWSNHASRAEELARRRLRLTPRDAARLIQHARALIALDRAREGRKELHRALAMEPANEDARRLQRSLGADLQWSATGTVTTERFNADRTPWYESSVQLGRETPAGPVIVRGTRATRFGLRDEQFEIEMYPQFRRGTYAYVSAGFDPDPVLFPARRIAADLFQSVGGGFELSAGVRTMTFARRVNAYTGSVSKYYGNWLFSLRTYVTPDTAGPSQSFHGSFRRYFGSEGHSYVGMRYGHGATREEIRSVNDIEVLNADVVAGELNQILSRRLGFSLSVGYGREELTFAPALRRLTVVSGLNVRF
jgi:YaiO family outer membrane protein